MLIDAAEFGDDEVVKKLLMDDIKLYPIDVNHKVLDDWTALHYAASEGHVKIAKLLID